MVLGITEKRQWYIYTELACLWGSTHSEGVLSTAFFIGVVISAILYIFTGKKEIEKQ